MARPPERTPQTGHDGKDSTMQKRKVRQWEWWGFVGPLLAVMVLAMVM